MMMMMMMIIIIIIIINKAPNNALGAPTYGEVGWYICMHAYVGRNE